MSDAKASGSGPLELLVVILKGQEFGIRTHAIREIRGWTPVTPMPRAPAEMLGISNLRGTAIPIIDLSVKLGMPAVEVTERSAIVVAEINGAIVGLLVDGVSGMMSVPADALQPVPAATSVYARYADGIIPTETALICFLNLSQLFDGNGEDYMAAAA